MYRVLFVLSGGLLLAACSSTPEWMSLDAFKPAPITQAVQFETDPAGATATLSTGQNCKTPCSISVPADKPLSVTFTLAGYQPASEQIEAVESGLQPNPVTAELAPAPPAKPAAKKPALRKKTSAAPKPKAAAKPAAATTAAAPAPAAAPAAQGTSSPWPSTAPKQ